MQKRIGTILLVAAVALILMIGFISLRVDYWISKPAEKFARDWAADVRALESSRALPKQWSQIREIAIRADTSPIQDWLVTVKPPIRKDPVGRYKLDVFLIHWIENYRYGVVVQYNLVDLTNNNTVWELARTLRLGIVY